jgi:hypothetical protein
LRLCSSGLGSIPSSSTSVRARGLVGLERLRLPARAIERQHQLPAQPLAQRLLGDQRLQLADQLAVAAAGQIGLDPVL